MGWTFKLPYFHTQTGKQSNFTVITSQQKKSTELIQTDMKDHHKLIIMATIKAKYL